MGSKIVGDKMKLLGPYVGGIDGFPPRKGGLLRQSWYWSWDVILGPEAVEITCKRNKLIAPTISVAYQAWTDLRGITFSPAKTTSNPLAIAAFGALGLAARVEWMVMEVAFTSSAKFASPPRSPNPRALFLQSAPAYEVTLLQEEAAMTWPASAGKIRLDDGSQPTHGTTGDIVEQLERAKRLQASGALSEEEFRQTKMRIIGTANET
jgi:hypothetical protein